MFALLVYLVLIAGVVALAVWLVDVGGAVSMVWGGYEVTTTVPLLVLGLVLLTVALLCVIWLVSWLWRGPRRIRKAVDQRRREKGYEALTSGLVAVAAGDAAEARRHAKKADNLLGHPPLTLLLTAQAAQLDGDGEAAERHFESMLERPETEFLGLRGLMIAALRRGDHESAREFARRAHALRPDARWAAEAVFDLQTLEGDWYGAQHTLEVARDRRAIGADVTRRRRAALLVEEGRQALESLDRAEALRRAREAHAEAPELVPATALLARLMIDEQKLRAAAKVIEKGWAATPHPDLAALYVETGRDSGLTHYKRISKLVSLAPEARESHIAAARAALDSGLTGEARRHLAEIGGEAVTVRIARLWAELEEAEGHAEKAETWLRRAVDAEPEATWQCDRCGNVKDAWHAVCDGCGSFDSFVWRRPGRVAASAEDAHPMLVLGS
jgi:HemY protein